MKYNCGESEHTKFQNSKKWHKCFAWSPVRVADNDCRWLEHVERKLVFPWNKEFDEKDRELSNICIESPRFCGYIYRLLESK